MLRNKQKFAAARKLRRVGWSYNEINRRIKVQKSTLHSWLKDISLTRQQHRHLKKLWENGLKKARQRAAEAHHQQTQKRLALANTKAKTIIASLGHLLNDCSLLKLTLAVLYLGEGVKNKSLVCLANSDPNICQAFVKILRKTYTLDEKKFRCHLHLRMDQNINTTIKYWSKILKISPKQFLKTQTDPRTAGKPTYKGYHGVCAIYYYDASLQKELIALGQEFINRIKRA